VQNPVQHVHETPCTDVHDHLSAQGKTPLAPL
jgi:hypothetical protein